MSDVSTPSSEKSNIKYTDADDYGAPPNDKWKAAYILLFVMGMATLIPWNMFITASNYFTTRLVDEPSLADLWTNLLTVTVCTSNIIGALLAIATQHKVSQRKRILIPLLVNSLVFIVCSILVFVELNATLFFIVSLICANACGLCGSFLQGGMFGLSGDLPPMYTQALMGGQGLAGVAVAINGYIAGLQTKAGKVDTFKDLQIPTLGYFLVAVFILLFSVFGFLLLERLPFVHHYQNASRSRGTPATTKSVSDYSATGTDLEQTPYNVNDPLLPQESPTLNWKDSKAVLKKVKFHALSVYLIFTFTLCVFPSITQSIAPVAAYTTTTNKFFEPTVYKDFSFVNFNLFDFLGRLIAGFISIDRLASGQVLAGLSSLRVVFTFLFLMCNVGGGAIPVVFKDDYSPMIIMFFFSLSNGLICSLSMMRAPGLVAENEMSTTGAMMSFFMMGGLLTGSLLSFGTKYL